MYKKIIIKNSFHLIDDNFQELIIIEETYVYIIKMIFLLKNLKIINICLFLLIFFCFLVFFLFKNSLLIVIFKTKKTIKELTDKILRSLFSDLKNKILIKFKKLINFLSLKN